MHQKLTFSQKKIKLKKIPNPNLEDPHRYVLSRDDSQWGELV